MRLRRGAAGLVAASLLGACPVAYAQTSSNKVTAEALFEDARKLVADGKFAEACPKFADSERLDPSPATLLNLASCWEKLGRTATAWATYKEAASAANAVGRKDYLATAERHSSALAPKLARLTVNVVQPVEGIQVLRDGVTVERAEWNAAIPVDTGSHTIAASAPGHKGWASAVEVSQDGVEVKVAVPLLEAAPTPEPAPVSDAVTPPSSSPPSGALPPPHPVESGDHSGPSTQHAIAWLVGGLGVVGFAVGTVYAVTAKNKYDDSRGQCEPTSPDLCTPQGVTERNDARSTGDAATIAFVIGGAAVAAGAVLWITAPRAAAERTGRAELVVTPTFGGAALRGTW